jgi:hypothetical protein
MCLFLLAHEYKRILSFFVLNKQADACSIYNVRFEKKWMRCHQVCSETSFLLVLLLAGCFIQHWRGITSFNAVQPDGLLQKEFIMLNLTF